MSRYQEAMGRKKELLLGDFLTEPGQSTEPRKYESVYLSCVSVY